VWQLAEDRSVFIEERPEHSGHAMHTIFVDDLGALVEQIARRGLEPAEREIYFNRAEGEVPGSRWQRDQVWGSADRGLGESGHQVGYRRLWVGPPSGARGGAECCGHWGITNG
jgi:hypothetical protein